MFNLRRIKPLCWFSALTVFVFSCGKNPLKVDISGIEAPVRIERLEKPLFEASDPEALAKLNAAWLETYGDLWESYVSVMLRAGSPRDSLIGITLERFISDEAMKQVYQDIQAEYPDLNWLSEELSLAFRYLRYYFPDARVPVIVTYNSVFNYGVYTTPDFIGVGLEMYLGPENRTVRKISPEVLPQFVKNKMRKEYLVIDVMRGWFEYTFLEPPTEQDFLSQIVHEGKIMYALDALFPDMPDHLKIRYTPEELDWCRKHEADVWKTVIERKLLYSIDPLALNQFIQDAPFTGVISQESPGRLGVWLGWQMVRAFMKDHPDLKLPDLVNEKNPRRILKSYKPKK